MSKKEKPLKPKSNLSSNLMPLWEKLPVPCKVWRQLKYQNNKVIKGTLVSKGISQGGYPYAFVLWDGERVPVIEHVNVINEDW